MSGVCDLCEAVACICPVPDQPPAGQADRERALQMAWMQMREAFVRHLTATHKVAWIDCQTCQESEAVLATDPDAGAQELWAAANEVARVLDQEIMPRYQELFEAAGLGAVSLSVAVEDATRVLARWRRAAGLVEQ